MDIVVAQGYEAGGPTREIASMVLVPEVVDAVGDRVPVLAAGGIGSGRQVLAAHAFGASGVWMGSSWLTTTEYQFGTSPIPTALVRAISSDTVRSRIYTGKPARLLKNKWTQAWAEDDAPEPLPMPLQNMAVGEAHLRMTKGGDPDVVAMPVGQIVGRMNEIRPRRGSHGKPAGRDREGARQTEGVTIRTLSSRVVYENPWLTLREDEIEYADGTRGIYSVVDKPDFALVMPFENDGFHLVEEYRYPLGGRRWQFPQGAFPKGVTGTPEELAAAELSEETGFTAGRLERLGYLNCAHGITGQGYHAFVATDLTPGRPRREATEQDMRQDWFPRGEVERMLREGVITDDSSLAAYLLFTMRE